MSWQNSPMGAPQQPMAAPQQPMAAAQQVAYEPHPFIGGRASALRALAAWRAAVPDAPRVALLTGSPGCGSSRLLTGFLMLCDPGHRERIDLTRLDPWTVPPALPAPAVPSAAGLTPAQLLWVLADHYGIDVARDAEVYEALGAGERVIVVPDVDEAGPVRAGRGPERMARELLLPLAGLPSVRLLAEVPRAVAAEIAAALPAGTAQVIDLDAPEHADLHGLTLQTQIALDPNFGAPRLPFTEDPQMRLWLAQGIASRTATGSGGSRLTAQLAVSAHLLAPEPPPTPRSSPPAPQTPSPCTPNASAPTRPSCPRCSPRWPSQRARDSLALVGTAGLGAGRPRPGAGHRQRNAARRPVRHHGERRGRSRTHPHHPRPPGPRRGDPRRAARRTRRTPLPRDGAA